MAPSLLSTEIKKNIAIIRLAHKTSNAISLALVEELADEVASLKAKETVRALVLTSANDKFFSIGFDIPSLLPLAREAFTTFYRTFNQFCLDLYSLPIPTIAAISGHAIAGGCILTLCCDVRVIAEGRKLIGLNEVKLGVPVPYIADRILHALVGSKGAREVMELGEFYPPEDALRLGLVDFIQPGEEVLEKALEQARLLASSPGEAYSLIKANRVENIVLEILERLEVKQMRFVDAWYADTARQPLQEASSKF
jgi:enoyl-CoA hydratase/carnithine racemase